MIVSELAYGPNPRATPIQQHPYHPTHIYRLGYVLYLLIITITLILKLGSRLRSCYNIEFVPELESRNQQKQRGGRGIMLVYNQGILFFVAYQLCSVPHQAA